MHAILTQNSLYTITSSSSLPMHSQKPFITKQGGLYFSEWLTARKYLEFLALEEPLPLKMSSDAIKLPLHQVYEGMLAYSFQTYTANEQLSYDRLLTHPAELIRATGRTMAYANTLLELSDYDVEGCLPAIVQRMCLHDQDHIDIPIITRYDFSFREGPELSFSWSEKKGIVEGVAEAIEKIDPYRLRDKTCRILEISNITKLDLDLYGTKKQISALEAFAARAIEPPEEPKKFRRTPLKKKAYHHDT